MHGSIRSVLTGCTFSFSGGKDSTVLLHIARELYPNMKAVFVDTGLEYPEIRSFVKTFDNVDWIRPRMGFKQVCEKYGFPLISKEVSECVYGARKYLTSIMYEVDASTNERTNERTNEADLSILLRQSHGNGKVRKYQFEWNKLNGIGKYGPTKNLSRIHMGGTTTSIVNSEELANILNRRMVNKEGGNNQRLAIMLGMLTKDKNHPIKANIPSKDRSMFAQVKWKFFLDAPFEISNRCCNVMKKEPAHRYGKETGRYPITAQMASESRLRSHQWLQNGCNAFDIKNPISNPMSFWTEQDVLLYIKTYDLPIASVYGDVVVDYEGMGQIEGQMSITDFMDAEEFDLDRPLLKTTGCNRTGCILCGFGCHLEKGEGRFERLKRTHPKVCNVLDHVTNNGVTYRQAIDWINKNNGKGKIIKY